MDIHDLFSNIIKPHQNEIIDYLVENIIKDVIEIVLNNLPPDYPINAEKILSDSIAMLQNKKNNEIQK